VRLVAMLNVYEESPQFLAAYVASLAKANVEHLVVCDGAYQLFPDGLTRPRSGPEQTEIIVESAHVLNIGVTIHRPKTAWRGNEVAKRNHLVQLALQETEESDWLLQLDADELVTSTPPDLSRRLEETEADVAGVYFFQRNVRDMQTPGWDSAPVFNPEQMVSGFYGHRILFRAQRDLHIEGAHYGYVANGVHLRGVEHETTGCLWLNDFKVEHRHDYRMPSRNIAATEYYELRALHQIEELLPEGQYANA
jgi:hypothetical protein